MTISTVALVVSIAAAILSTVVLWRVIQRERAWRRRIAGQVDRLDTDPEECTVCALDYVGKRPLHVIAETFDESREFGAGAGTSMTAEYCADHCPGGCSHAHDHQKEPA